MSILGCWERLQDISRELKGDLKLITTKNSMGKTTQKVVIEYEYEEK